jgi:DNA-binding beta-propeller fold protein YncE
MSRVAGTQAEDRGRTEAPAGIQAVVSDKAAVSGKAVVIDGKIRKTGSRGPGFSITK